MGVRVYELARTLGLSSKDLMHELKRQGIDLKSHMSSIDDETAELVVDLLKHRRRPQSLRHHWRLRNLNLQLPFPSLNRPRRSRSRRWHHPQRHRRQW